MNHIAFVATACAAFAAALVGVAFWMLTLARGQEKEEEILLRLRASGPREDSVIPADSTPGIQNPVLRYLVALTWRAGFEVGPSRMLILLGIFLFLSVLVFAIGGVLAGIIAVGMASALVYGTLTRMAARRRTRIIEQLPSYLENVIRVLSAGNSLEESLASAARESVDPIRPLFLSVTRQVKLGAPVDQVLADVGHLYRVRDLRVLALAANVNRKFGGSLRGVFKSLITAVRQRGTAARELRALTAETRFSAFVLAGVPTALTVFILFRNASYYGKMWSDPQGRILLIATALLQVVGTFILWRMMASTEDTDT